MGARITEVDQQAIAQILGDVAVKALDHLGTRRLIRQDQVAQLFRIQLAGQRRRVDQIAEQHRELAALCCRFMLCHTWSRPRRRVGGRALRLRWFGRCGGRCRWGACASCPDQDFALFIHGQFFGVDQVIFEVFQQVVIKLQPPLEEPIGQALLPLEERENLLKDGIVIHYRPSTAASATSAWGSQNVISMARYNSMAADSSARAGPVRPILAYRVPRPSWQWARSGTMPKSSARP